MYKRNEPTVGAWYVNPAGKLMKVKMLIYHQQTQPVDVVIEYLDGGRRLVGMGEWSCLELNQHLNRGGSVIFRH